MNPYYKQPVLVLGLIGPILVIVVLFGLGLHFKGKLEESFAQKKSAYSDYRKTQLVREGLAKTVLQQAPLMKSWMSLFETATASRVNGILGEVQKRFPSSEFQQTSFHRTNSNGGIGGASSQLSIQIQLKFRGTYRGLQNAFLELETQMPHLQLDNIKLSQETNRDVLAAELTYTAWQKE